MPGLNQLKKFARDIDVLGNEAQRRTEKEETLPVVALPTGISEADDSDEFLFGLPEQKKDLDANDETNIDSSSNDSNLAESSNDIDIDAILAAAANDGTEGTLEQVDSSNASDFSLPGFDENIDLSALDSFDIPENSAETLEPASSLETLDSFDIPEIPAETLEPASSLENLDSFDIPEIPAENLEPASSLENLDSFDIPEIPAESLEPVSSLENLDSFDNFDNLDSFEEMDFTPSELESQEIQDITPGDIESVQEVLDSSLDDLGTLENSSTNEELDFSMPDFSNDVGNLDSIPAESENLDELDFSVPDFDTSSLDVPDFSNDVGNLGTDDFSSTAESLESFENLDVPETSNFDFPETDFSTPDFDVSNFTDLSETNFDSEEGVFENTDESSDDFSSFSDFDLVPPEVPQETKKRSVPFASGKGKSKKEEVLSNELTEDEYKVFLQNLNYYPLNLRIAIEEMIVGNEFNDDVVMEIVRKVIKKIPARQLAGNVEKLMDRAIPVPANYEKRTVAEYEAYQQSFEYRLKNKILPFTLVGLIAVGFCILFGFLTAKFVVTPVQANNLYKEGYTLLESGLYPQSELKFNEAAARKPMKKWHFKYARAYVDKNQYERASNMYERLLYTFDYDLKAGLEYARMELEERSNYPRAEEIVRRFVLDHHINSPDGLLLLGDVFLEWATNRDPSKFEEARVQYANLIQLYGQKPLYLSRMMRYFIRTDNLEEVLQLKEYFYPKLKKDILEPEDIVELSGYLLDKLYGDLPAKDEYLRAAIEDVRELLELGVEKGEDIPEAMYNYGRYFVETGSKANAQIVLEEALLKFENAEKKTQKRLISQIDTYRLLGELSLKDLDYLKAENYYVEGLTLFENERDNSDLQSDEKVGILYSDLADLDYFISGDFDAALSNYTKAIENYNDTPSIRYRVGYIQYSNENYSEALGSFIKSINEKPSDKYLLLALGNTLTLRNSTSAAQGYYEKLITLLDLDRNQAGILHPQTNSMDGELVELYMKAANNLGVVLSLRANQTGNGNLLPKAMANFEESIRAFDALTRNQETMIRVQGSNLASYNQKYLTYTHSDYEPTIYTELSPVLEGEKIPEKSVVK